MIKKKSFFEVLVVLLSILVLLIFSYKPIYDNFKNKTADRYYYGASEYPLDLMGSLSTVQEGYLGHWMRMPKATTTIEAKATFLKMEYILIGQAARLFHIDPLFMYFLSRFVISIIFLFSLYFIVRNVFKTPGQRIVSFILCLFATGIINPLQGMGIMHRLPLDSLVFQRLTLSAHHYLLSGFFTILSIYFLSLGIDSKRWKYIFIAGLFGFLATLIYPAGMVLVVLSLPLYLILKIIRLRLLLKSFSLLKTEILFLGVYIIVSFIPLLYFRYASSFWDFNALSKTELIVPFTILPFEYIQAIGLVYIFSLIAYIPILKSGKTFFLLLIPWIVIHPLSIFIVSYILGINSIRFFLTPYFLVFAILATVGIFWIVKRVSFAVVITIIVLASGYYSYETSMISQRVCFCLVSSVYDYGYPKKEVMDALFWLRKNTEESNIVLSGFYAGTLIPAFSGNYVYTSWWHYIMSPPNINTTSTLVNRFYSHNMDNLEALEFLKRNRISYVFFGDGERKNLTDGGDLRYPFLKQKNKNNQTIIYAVE